MRIRRALLVAAVALTFAPRADAAQDVHRVIVRFAGTPGIVPIASIYGSDAVVVLAPGPTAAQAAAHVARRADVLEAEPDLPLRLSLSAPNDPRFADQYAHVRIASVDGWSVYPATYAPPAGPTIAVLDSGIDTSHPEFSGRIDVANSRCFLGSLLCTLSGGYRDDNGHGTHVAGIAAAATNNGEGVAGVAYNARVMVLKVCDLLGTCSTSTVASAINWARDRGARVINMSLGGTGNSSTLQNAVRAAWEAGVVLVAAAGNDGNATVNYPAGYDEVISVASTTSNDARSSFSNTNASVELAAPGSSVLSTWPGGYDTLSGTSMSTPHVTGLAALLFGQDPARTNQQVRDRMSACADDLGASGSDASFGSGRINLSRTLGAC